MTKTITFAIMHFSIAFGVTYLITGDLILRWLGCGN
ncbi:membrane protein [Alishewanella longhuensis]